MSTITETTEHTKPVRQRVPWSWHHIVGAIVVGLVLGILLSLAVLSALAVLGAPLSTAAQGGILTVGLYLGLVLGTWLIVIKRGGATWHDVGFRPVSVRTLLTMIPVLILLLVANAAVSVGLVAIFGDIQN
ncbi:MAG: hypothetical protein M3506_06270, partial [Chloroflexota bacterium]|nr:hypothetical protein [Chloroflexota bacterium]